MELQAFIYIINVLKSKKYSDDEKLKLIHIRTLILCYVYLFIISSFIRFIIILCPWSLMFLCYYLTFSMIRFDKKQMKFFRLVEKWVSEDRITLYEIRVNYFKNDKHRRTHGKSSKRP